MLISGVNQGGGIANLSTDGNVSRVQGVGSGDLLWALLGPWAWPMAIGDGTNRPSPSLADTVHDTSTAFASSFGGVLGLAAVAAVAYFVLLKGKK